MSMSFDTSKYITSELKELRKINNETRRVLRDEYNKMILDYLNGCSDALKRWNPGSKR